MLGVYGIIFFEHLSGIANMHVPFELHTGM